MKHIYSCGKPIRAIFLSALFMMTVQAYGQTPTTVINGVCGGVIASFNTNNNGFNSPSVYGSIFDGSFYYNASRGYFGQTIFILIV